MRPGDVQVDFSSGLLTFDDGVKLQRIPRGGFVDAKQWAVRPGEVDMTAEIQAAFDETPIGSTLIFEQGVYPISDNVILPGGVNVIAHGAIFDLGTSTPTSTFTPGVPENHDGSSYLTLSTRESGSLTNKAGLIWGTRNGRRPERNYIRGLEVRRTAADASASARLYAGIVMHGCFECTLEEVAVRDLRDGVVLTGISEGCVHNRIVRLKATNCRYPLTLHAKSGGWVNQNTIPDFRAIVENSIRIHGSWNQAQWEFVRILWGSDGTTPNNIQLYGATLEESIGRKLRHEGQDCIFLNCRWETSNGSNDITIGESSRANSNYARNYFIGGQDLEDIYSLNRVEFKGTVEPLNNRNTFLTGSGHAFYGSDQGGTFTTCLTVAGTGDEHRLLGFFDTSVPRVETLIGYAKLPASIASSHLAAFTFRGTDSAVKNWIALHNSSPYDLRIGAGLNIQNVFRVRLDGTIDVNVQNPTIGRTFLQALGTTGTFDFYNSSSDSNDVLRLLDASRNLRAVLKVSESGITSGHYSVLVFYEASTPSSPTLGNALALHSTTFGGGTAAYPLRVEKGLIVNPGLGDFDSRFSGDNLAALWYLKASTDRIGVGTATPAELLDVSEEIRCRMLRLDGDQGSGVASTISLTNVATAPGGATGTATLGLVGNANTPAAVAQSHWVKAYIGTTVVYIPAWT